MTPAPTHIKPHRTTPFLLVLAAAFALLILLAPHASAQSDAQFSQYYVVKNYYNPAAIGTSDMLNVRLGGRAQWIGIKHAPQTFILSGEMPLKLLNKRFAIGALMQQESIGLFKNLSLGVQLGYKRKIFKGQLTAGVQIGFINQTFKGSDIYIPDDDDYHQSNDDALPKGTLTGNAFDLGLGVYYTFKNYWVGLSCTHLTQPSIGLKNDTGAASSTTGEESMEPDYEFQVGRSLYFMAGGNIPIKNTLFEVMPSLMIKSDLTFTTGEITARVRYNKFLTGGLGYRYKDAITAVIGADYKGFFLGYSYDYPVSAIAKASSGSHEIFAGYSMKLDLSDKNKNKHKSIRIM